MEMSQEAVVIFSVVVVVLIVAILVTAAYLKITKDKYNNLLDVQRRNIGTLERIMAPPQQSVQMMSGMPQQTMFSANDIQDRQKKDEPRTFPACLPSEAPNMITDDPKPKKGKMPVIG